MVPRSPADNAGVRNGDVVVGADGSEVKRTKDLLIAISKAGAGGSVRLDVDRMGRRGTLHVRPSEAPPIQRYDGR